MAGSNLPSAPAPDSSDANKASTERSIVPGTTSGSGIDVTPPFTFTATLAGPADAGTSGPDPQQAVAAATDDASRQLVTPSKALDDAPEPAEGSPRDISLSASTNVMHGASNVQDTPAPAALVVPVATRGSFTFPESSPSPTNSPLGRGGISLSAPPLAGPSSSPLFSREKTSLSSTPVRRRGRHSPPLTPGLKKKSQRIGTGSPSAFEIVKKRSADTSLSLQLPSQVTEQSQPSRQIESPGREKARAVTHGKVFDLHGKHGDAGPSSSMHSKAKIRKDKSSARPGTFEKKSLALSGAAHGVTKGLLQRKNDSFVVPAIVRDARSRNAPPTGENVSSLGGQVSSRKKKVSNEKEEEMHQCELCKRVFYSWKAYFGHLRCHPERWWRGAFPPPVASKASAGSPSKAPAGNHPRPSSKVSEELVAAPPTQRPAIISEDYEIDLNKTPQELLANSSSDSEHPAGPSTDKHSTPPPVETVESFELDLNKPPPLDLENEEKTDDTSAVIEEEEEKKKPVDKGKKPMY